MAHIRLKYVHQVVGRDGKVRRYFRRRGRDRVPLPGLPGSSEFNQAYEAALAGELPQPIGASRCRPGTIDAGVAGYLTSIDFTTLAAGTKKNRLRVLERLRIEHGAKGIASLRREHIERMVAAKSTPSVALHFLLTLRELMRFAVRTGLRSDDPTEGIRRPKFKLSGGFYSWTEADIQKFEARHPIGTRARLAMVLGLYTGQRRGDVIGMGWQHVREGVIHIKQSKTRTLLAIPIHPSLKVVLDAASKEHLLFLPTRSGQGFTPEGFTGWFKDVCAEAGLPDHASFHGLRKAAARRLAEAGCSAHQIAAITGHKSLAEVTRYTTAADQVRLAKQAMDALQVRPHGEPSGNEKV